MIEFETKGADQTHEQLARGDRTQESRDGIRDGDKIDPNFVRCDEIEAKREKGDRIQAVRSRSNPRVAVARRSNPKAPRWNRRWGDKIDPNFDRRDEIGAKEGERQSNRVAGSRSNQ